MTILKMDVITVLHLKWAFDHCNSDQENEDFRLLAACNHDDYGNDDDDDIAAG